MNKIKKLAHKLYKSYDTASPYKICKKLNIHIIELDIPKTVNGFYLNKDGTNMIILNKKLGDETKNVVCAHELGHVLLHRNINAYNIKDEDELKLSKYELEADYFCACLLLSDFEEFYKNKMYFMSIKDISSITGLPERIVKLWFLNIENFNLKNDLEQN